MGAENSHRYNSGCIENFLRNMSTHISSQELPFPLEGFGVFMCILSYGAKMFDYCVRALHHHVSYTPSFMRFHEMHEQLCFPLGTRQIHFPDIYLVAIVFHGRNFAFKNALHPYVTVPEVSFTTTGRR